MSTRKIIDIEQNGEKVWPKGHAKATFMSDGSTVEDTINQIGTGGGGITVETDPVFAASPAAGITTDKIQEWDRKQDALISGINIKTINGYSILGSGNLTVSGSGDAGYSAKISLSSPQFNAVLKDSTGHYIEFTFDTTNGAGGSMGEGVTCTYTITRGTNQTVVTEKYRYNTKARFGLDKYLQDGANDIVINIVGDISGLSTSVGVTYQVVNLALDVDYDVSTVYDLSNKSYAIVEVPFTLSGYGTKLMEWYIDGVALDFVKNDDEVVDVTATRTKFITISNLSQGTHSLQVRAYTIVNGEKFYTDTHYYDLIVYTGANQDLIIGVAATIPSKYGILGTDSPLKIYDAVQYKTYTLRFATYSPTAASNTQVTVKVNNDEVGVVSSSNWVENEFRYTPTTYGNKTLIISAGAKEYIIPMEVSKTSMNIDEITTALALDFNSGGRTNKSSNKDSWSFGEYVGTFSGFNWNNTSGWVDGRLEMNAGTSFGINYAPLAVSPTNTGKTIEIEWATKNVTNDDAVICDLRGENGVGILITATKVSMRSADGIVIETEYKSDENVRVGFVINKSRGTSNQRLSFIYANGIVSRGEQWAINDDYTSNKEILFTATNEAEISLKSIRIYDTALTSDQMLNNFILYRDTVAEMLNVYDRNDIYVDGTATFSPDKMMSRVPVMIVTGDIPVLENSSDKDTQIVVDIEYKNMQHPERSFTMKGAAMRPQGTSSMGYPKKNFRIYTQEVDGTILYDANGNVVEDKLYSFKEGAQPVNCWCLKADYAESSGTHNTGIARLWNDALKNAQIEGEYVCRTNAQKKAIEAGYEYDVRTTIDGFPILLFYRPTATDDIIFIGKYNFNNDKSTESVFGFEGIPNFDNSKMQCWEVLNNGNDLALFTTTEGFDEGWAEAFESRYPDTKTPYTGDLKAFCEWMTNVSQEDFATQKWEHLNVYMMAAYWCYLMRHAAADQFVKNAMFTSEDGEHFYYILYDNDTINGLINTGHLEIRPTDDRQTINESGEYVFAGHDSRLWNMLEADEEFKNIVSAVDNALYSSGISYLNTIKVFDEEQADKWVERVYNQDAQYKYVGPYVEKGINNLFMLQGKRDLHRKWWLAKRFSIFDAKYVSGTYKSQAVELKCINGTPAGQQFTIKAGYPIDYGYGINDVPREFGIPLAIGESKEFTTREVVNRGDPIRIYGAPNITEIDLSKMASKLAVVTIANVYDDALGTKLTKLVVGNPDVANYEVAEISGLKQASALEYLDIQGMTKMSSIDLSKQAYFKTLKAKGSGISSISFSKGAPVERLELPSTMRHLSLEQLPYLNVENILFENISSLAGLTITSCPNISGDFYLIDNWIENKSASDANCSLIMDHVNWEGVSGEKMARIASFGNISLRGKISLTDITEEQGELFLSVFGTNVFNEDAQLYIDAPLTLSIAGPSSILEGETATYTSNVYPIVSGTYKYELTQTRTGCSINQETGVLTTTENGLNTSDIIVKVTFTSSSGEELSAITTTSVEKRTYPLNITIEGDGNLTTNTVFSWKSSTPQSSINGEYNVEWAISGGITPYYTINPSENSCTLVKKSTPNDTSTGTLTLNIKKKIDNSIVSTASIAITHAIVWPTNVIIEGSENPVENGIYRAVVNTAGVTGEYVGEWQLSGDVASYVNIISQSTTTCEIGVVDAPTDFVNGVLTYKLKKAYNNQDIITVEKSLKAIIEGVVITAKSNAPIQACLYEAGLVANEAYSLKEEVERITADQLQPEATADTSIFKSRNNEIEHFDEFEYFTAITTIKPYTFGGTNNYPNFKTIKLPPNLISIESNAFASSGLQEIVFNNKLSSLGEYSFYFTDLKEVVLPASVNAISRNAFTNCSHIETLDLSQTKITEIAANTNLTALKVLKLPSTIKKIGRWQFYSAYLSDVYCDALVAPIAEENHYSAFGSAASPLVGSSVNQSKRFLHIPFNATGYYDNGWEELLDNGKFNIYGKLTITSNKSEAMFDVTYVTESDVVKTINISAGTVYINDIKYNTTITITPNALTGGYTWDKASAKFTYTTSANSASFNANIYPSSVAINGNATIIGGNSANYTADITPSNFDIDVTYTWSLSSSSNASISSNGNQCTITTNVVNAEENLTLSCVITTSDGKTLQSSRTIKLITKPNFITATYNVTSTTSETVLLNKSFQLDKVTYMEVDGVEVTPVRNYTFSRTGSHVVKLTTTNIVRAFADVTSLISIDFSECDGTKINNFLYAFYRCNALTSIEWGECKFPNVTTLNHAFQLCSSLTSIDLSPFAGAQITSMNSVCDRCKNITQIDFSFLAGNNSATIDWYRMVAECEKLTVLDLTPFGRFTVYSESKVDTMTDLEGCTALETIIMPFISAPLVANASNCFGSAPINYVGYNNAKKGTNKLYVPSNSTGYDSGYWLDPLLNSEKCGFTLSATL